MPFWGSNFYKLHYRSIDYPLQKMDAEKEEKSRKEPEDFSKKRRKLFFSCRISVQQNQQHEGQTLKRCNYSAYS